MKSCRDIEGSMAASFYDPLEHDEEAALRSHLASCASCAKTHAELQALVTDMPVEPVVFTGDLRPVLAAAQSGRAQAFSWVPRLLAAMACLIVASVGMYQYLSSSDAGTSVLVAENPIDTIRTEVQRLLDDGDAIAARARLESAIDRYTGDSTAAEFQLRIAGIEFEYLHRYEESYNKYLSVINSNAEVWTKSSGKIKERFDLLTEARDANFEPLYQLDVARSQGESGLANLESLMARYPGRFLASEALTTMAALVADTSENPLEVLKTRCTNPLTVAQIDVRLGEEYWLQRNNPTRGRELLEAVAQGPHEIPAKMARETLARLEPGNRP